VRPVNNSLTKLTFLRRYAYITLGVFIMVAGFYYFILPPGYVIGGVSGFGVLFGELLGLRVSLIVAILNVVLLLVGWYFLGFKSFTRSIYGSVLFPFFLFLLETFSPFLPIPEDPLLYVIFGGAIIGIGFGILIKYGGTSGGTDIPIKILHRRLKLPLSVSLYLVDGAIIAAGVIAFFDDPDRGIAMGLYAVLVMVISGKFADYVVAGSNTLRAVHIVTTMPDQIKDLIYEAIERGVSLVPAEGGYTKEKKTMIVSVITRNEYYIIRNIIAEKDPEAFVFTSPATEIQGDFTTYQGDD